MLNRLVLKHLVNWMGVRLSGRSSNLIIIDSHEYQMWTTGNMATNYLIEDDVDYLSLMLTSILEKYDMEAKKVAWEESGRPDNHIYLHLKTIEDFLRD